MCSKALDLDIRNEEVINSGTDIEVINLTNWNHASQGDSSFLQLLCSETIEPMVPYGNTENESTYFHNSSIPESCNFRSCSDEIYIACPLCYVALCFTHQDTECKDHNSLLSEIFERKNAYFDKHFYNSTGKTDNLSKYETCANEISSDHTSETESTELEIGKRNNGQSAALPEDFVPDEPLLFEDGVNLSHVNIPRGRKRKIEKTKKNKGEQYSTEKGIVKPAKREQPGLRCSSNCKQNCSQISEEDRKNILTDFWNLGCKRLQHEFICRHVSEHEIKRRRTKTQETSRRSTTRKYCFTINKNEIQVCCKFFTSTLNISEVLVGRYLKAKTSSGFLNEDGRGGLSTKRLEKCITMREEVISHINRFPRVESHYVRRDSTYQYLSPDLNINKMYEMYKTKKGMSVACSYPFYKNVFNSLKIKFHRPKKDLCSVCLVAEKSESKTPEYMEHKAEKEAVRKEMKQIVENSRNGENTAALVFDLQQVIYVPISNMSDIFYRSRLSCFNFTVYNMGTKKGTCYFWNESWAKRGSREIASCLYQALLAVDNSGYTCVKFFSDSCIGQNKNSVVISAFISFLEHSKNVKSISISYFEPGHGQSSGDSMHSLCEREIALAGRVEGAIQIPNHIIPCLAKACKKNPYNVVKITQNDVLDWKVYADNIGILKARKNQRNGELDWKKMRSMKLVKNENCLMYKNSHMDEDFETVLLPRRNNEVKTAFPPKAYTAQVKIPKNKFDDLMFLCKNVITDPENRSFYENLNC